MCSWGSGAPASALLEIILEKTSCLGRSFACMKLGTRDIGLLCTGHVAALGAGLFLACERRFLDRSLGDGTHLISM